MLYQTWTKTKPLLYLSHGTAKPPDCRSPYSWTSSDWLRPRASYVEPKQHYISFLYNVVFALGPELHNFILTVDQFNLPPRGTGWTSRLHILRANSLFSWTCRKFHQNHDPSYKLPEKRLFNESWRQNKQLTSPFSLAAANDPAATKS